jgi:hypothetical protein
MKYFTSDPGKLMPAEMLINPSDTVLESANDQGGPQTGSAGASSSRWQKQRLFRQKDSGKNLEAKFLALGTASVLATVMPLAAEAKIIAFENQSLDLLTKQTLNIDGDGVPDLSCEASNYITANRWGIGNHVECVGVNGEVLLSENFVSCEPPGPDEEDNDPSSQPNLPKCPSGADPTGPKYLDLALKTSSDLNAWVKIVIDAEKPSAQAVAWGYECDEELGECPPLPPPPPTGLNASVDSSGKVAITWTNDSDKDNSNNETRFKIYRDGKLIETIAANSGGFHDAGLPCALLKSVTYAVIATNSAGDSEPAMVEVTIPNRCPPNRPMLFVAIDGAGSGKVISSPNTISCEASDCHVDPKDPLVPKCNIEKCQAQMEIGTTVTLTPVADPGSVFSSWGFCADGKSEVVKVTMMENKLCNVFFQKSPSTSPSGTKSRPPTLPSLGECVAIDSSGKHIDTTARISVEVSVNGTDSQPVATVKSTDQIVIRANLRMDPLHQPARVDILVFGHHQETEQDTALDWWMMDKDGKVFPWNQKPADLVSFSTGVSLTAEKATTLEIYRGTPPFNSGMVEVFLGYRLEDGKMVCGSKPVEINVVK